MSVPLPFLSAYDPPGESEGSLDPLGLYALADRLAVTLVPAVRERMQRIRFLTAMAVGTLVTADLESDTGRRGTPPPWLVWEWLVIEALLRQDTSGEHLWGVPGTLVTRRALARHGYLDARSYLKTPSVFGFHGVYKRLALHLGLVDVHLGPGPHTETLVTAWARGRGLRGLEHARPLLERWNAAVARSRMAQPARTHPGWDDAQWTELAQAFAPDGAAPEERRYLRELLHAGGAPRLGALPALWQLQTAFDDDGYAEEPLHARLRQHAPATTPLLEAIAAYEAFARGLHDAFDALRASASGPDARGCALSEMRAHAAFGQAVHGLPERFAAARQALAGLEAGALASLFEQRFETFAAPLDPVECAHALCTHHETVQRAKSAAGKRPWFDRTASDRIFMRQAYRAAPRENRPGHYVHAYRAWPVRRFWADLS